MTTTRPKCLGDEAHVVADGDDRPSGRRQVGDDLPDARDARRRPGRSSARRGRRPACPWRGRRQRAAACVGVAQVVRVGVASPGQADSLEAASAAASVSCSGPSEDPAARTRPPPGPCPRRSGGRDSGRRTRLARPAAATRIAGDRPRRRAGRVPRSAGAGRRGDGRASTCRCRSGRRSRPARPARSRDRHAASGARAVRVDETDGLRLQARSRRWSPACRAPPDRGLAAIERAGRAGPATAARRPSARAAGRRGPRAAGPSSAIRPVVDRPTTRASTARRAGRSCARRRASRCRSRPARGARRRRAACPPGRAGPSARRGRGARGRIASERRDDDELPLAAGQARVAHARRGADAERRERGLDAGDRLARGQPEVHRPEGDLLEDRAGHAGQLGGRVLEPDPDPRRRTRTAACRPSTRRRSTTVAGQRAADRAWRETGGDQAQRRLAGLVRSDHPDDLAVGQRQVDVVEDVLGVARRSGTTPASRSSIVVDWQRAPAIADRRSSRRMPPPAASAATAFPGRVGHRPQEVARAQAG